MRKAKAIPNEAFLPVPEGTRIRYQHFYARRVKPGTVFGKNPDALIRLYPPVLIGTGAWLVNAQGIEIPNTYAESKVHHNDTAVKKLGRLKAHNRCIKKYLASNHA